MNQQPSERRQLAAYLLRQAGKKSTNQIAKELGKDPLYVRCTASDYGVSMAMPPKVDEHDKTLIRQLRQEGLTLQQIADKFDVSVSKVATLCKDIDSPSDVKRKQILAWLTGKPAMTINEALAQGLGLMGFDSRSARPHFEALVKAGLVTRRKAKSKAPCFDMNSQRNASIVKYKVKQQ